MGPVSIKLQQNISIHDQNQFQPDWVKAGHQQIET